MIKLGVDHNKAKLARTADQLQIEVEDAAEMGDRF